MMYLKERTHFLRYIEISTFFLGLFHVYYTKINYSYGYINTNFYFSAKLSVFLALN